MQRFFCQHCQVESPSILAAFLHLFTNHKHQDMAVPPQMASVMLRNMQVMPPQREWVVWEN